MRLFRRSLCRRLSRMPLNLIAEAKRTRLKSFRGCPHRRGAFADFTSVCERIQPPTHRERYQVGEPKETESLRVERQYAPGSHPTPRHLPITVMEPPPSFIRPYRVTGSATNSRRSTTTLSVVKIKTLATRHLGAAKKRMRLFLLSLIAEFRGNSRRPFLF